MEKTPNFQTLLVDLASSHISLPSFYLQTPFKHESMECLDSSSTSSGNDTLPYTSLNLLEEFVRVFSLV